LAFLGASLYTKELRVGLYDKLEGALEEGVNSAFRFLKGICESMDL